MWLVLCDFQTVTLVLVLQYCWLLAVVNLLDTWVEPSECLVV